ncbi:MAG: hypothetical protein ABSH08_12115, partial [Tepidisphaeraceae bacterium]
YAAIAVLVIGTVLYGVVCIPSYSRSYWPPVDRILEAPPWLWVFPIPMFALIMPGGRFSRRLLFLYAVLTSGIDAWTFPFANMNPHPRRDFDLWFENLITAVPFHVVLTLIITLLSRLAYRLLRISPALRTEPQSWRYRWSRIALLSGIPVTALVFPFGYQRLTDALDSAEGARMADADWANQKASVISRQESSYRRDGTIDFISFFDPDSGFPFKHSWMRRWEPGYNAEICNLIKSRGVPTWSLKNRAVSDADMRKMLTSSSMTEITSYPYCWSPNIVLFRGGGVTPWGTSVSSNSKYLDIQSRYQENPPLPLLGEENDSAFVGQLPEYPGTYFVRCGKSVVACTADGWILQVATDDR